MSNYRNFALVYDRLTENIDYQKRGEYFDAVIQKHGGKKGILLDLGCGTGRLCAVMEKLGYDVLGVDNSEDMLAEAQERKIRENLSTMFLCQEMPELDLYGTIDVAVSSLDSLNHLTEYTDFCAAISQTALFLDPDGVFVFDLNSCYKHRQILQNNTFVYDYDDVYCVWQNTLQDDLLVEMELTFFLEEDGLYERMEDAFSERAYTQEQIEQALDAAGLKLWAVYDEDSFDPPRADSERLIYVARHKNPQGRQKM